MATQKIETGLIADSAVTTAKIADNSVTGAKIAAASLDDQVKGISSSADAVAITIDSSENVGIGDTSPENRLHVKGAANTSTTVQIESASNQYAPKILFDGLVGASTDYLLGQIVASWDAHTNEVAAIRFESGSDTTNKDDGLISFWTSDASSTLEERMRIDSSGNVGIGRLDPSAILHIEVADNTEFLRATITGNESWAFKGASGSGATDYVSFGIAGGTQCMTWQEDGNVGIGNTNPSYALDVYDVGEAWIRADSSHTTESTANSGLRFAHGGVNHGVLYHRGSDDALLYFDNIASSTRFLIDSSGNVGINASSPTSYANSQTTLVIQDSTSPAIAWSDTGQARDWFAVAQGSGLHFIYADGGGSSSASNVTSSIVLDNSGKVGIGADSPSGSLHIEYNTVSGGDNYIHMRKTDQGAGQGIFIGMPTASNNLQIMNHANNAITFHTQTSDAERFRIDTNGVRLEDGAMAYEQNRPLFSGANASSYSSSTNLAYTKSTDQYSITGEAFKARVRARAYTKYVHMKTNLTSDNIMFFFRIYGYFYNYGVNECVRGGYTYNGSVITESVANAYNTNSNYTIGDFYRSSSGNYLCVRLDVHQTGYTEGEALVFFGSHANTVTRELEITDMQHRDDGNNAY